MDKFFNHITASMHEITSFLQDAAKHEKEYAALREARRKGSTSIPIPMGKLTLHILGTRNLCINPNNSGNTNAKLTFEIGMNDRSSAHVHELEILGKLLDADRAGQEWEPRRAAITCSMDVFDVNAQVEIRVYEQSGIMWFPKKYLGSVIVPIGNVVNFADANRMEWDEGDQMQKNTGAGMDTMKNAVDLPKITNNLDEHHFNTKEQLHSNPSHPQDSHSHIHSRSKEDPNSNANAIYSKDDFQLTRLNTSTANTTPRNTDRNTNTSTTPTAAEKEAESSYSQSAPPKSYLLHFASPRRKGASTPPADANPNANRNANSIGKTQGANDTHYKTQSPTLSINSKHVRSSSISPPTKQEKEKDKEKETVTKCEFTSISFHDSIHQPFKTCAKNNAWYRLFPLPENRSGYNSMVEDLIDLGLEQPQNPAYIQLKLELELQHPYVVALFLGEPRCLPETSPPNYQWYELVRNVIRIRESLTREIGALVILKEAQSWRNPVLSLGVVLWILIMSTSPLYLMPSLIVLSVGLIQFIVREKSLLQAAKRAKPWNHQVQIPSDKTRTPVAEALKWQRQLSHTQTFLDRVASVLERSHNALNWADPTISLVTYLMCCMVSLGLGYALYFLLYSGIPRIVFGAVIAAVLVAPRYKGHQPLLNKEVVMSASMESVAISSDVEQRDKSTLSNKQLQVAKIKHVQSGNAGPKSHDSHDSSANGNNPKIESKHRENSIEQLWKRINQGFRNDRDKDKSKLVRKEAMSPRPDAIPVSSDSQLPDSSDRRISLELKLRQQQQPLPSSKCCSSGVHSDMLPPRNPDSVKNASSNNNGNTTINKQQRHGGNPWEMIFRQITGGMNQQDKKRKEKDEQMGTELELISASSSRTNAIASHPLSESTGISTPTNEESRQMNRNALSPVSPAGNDYRLTDDTAENIISNSIISCICEPNDVVQESPSPRTVLRLSLDQDGENVKEVPVSTSQEVLRLDLQQKRHQSAPPSGLSSSSDLMRSPSQLQHGISHVVYTIAHAMWERYSLRVMDDREFLHKLICLQQMHEVCPLNAWSSPVAREFADEKQGPGEGDAQRL